MTTAVNFQDAKNYILKKQEKGLYPQLYYHSLRHVLDVYAAAKRIALEEKLNEKELILLKIAALYHDSGYMVSDKNHEEASCKIAQDSLPQFGFSPTDISIICQMIRATKIPQQPKTHLEEILCDADLDYLGRNDFYQIGDLLFRELFEKKYIKDKSEWNTLQIQFLKAHSFFTVTSKRERESQKQEHLKQLTNNK